MARGLDKEVKNNTPPRRNPFRQEIANKEDWEKEREEGPDQIKEELIKELDRGAGFMKVEEILGRGHWPRGERERYLYYIAEMQPEGDRTDQRLFDSYLEGFSREQQEALEPGELFAFLDQLKQNKTKDVFTDDVIFSTRFLLASWMRREQRPVPSVVVLEKLAGAKVLFEDFAHQARLLREMEENIPVLAANFPPEEQELVESLAWAYTEKLKRAFLDELALELKS